MTNSYLTTRTSRRLEIHFVKQATLSVRVYGYFGLRPARNLARGARVCRRKQRGIPFWFCKFMGVFATSQIAPDAILQFFINRLNNGHSPGSPMGVCRALLASYQ